VLNIRGKLTTPKAIKKWDEVRRLGRLVPVENAERDGEAARAAVLTHLFEELDVEAFAESFRRRLHTT
jgi:hypothetical protein